MDTSKNIFAYEDLFGWSLSDISRSEKVVIFTSSITDLRMILKYLVDRDMPFRQIEMDMGIAHNREGFRDLCRMTDFELLPQIFINGHFIGGFVEFYEHAAIMDHIVNGKKPGHNGLQ